MEDVRNDGGGGNESPCESITISSSQCTIRFNPCKISSPSQYPDDLTEEEEAEGMVNVIEETADTSGTTRSSPASVSSSCSFPNSVTVTVKETVGHSKGDEIAMSPMMEVENPTSLMELPDNILQLPISPCGPHDHQSA